MAEVVSANRRIVTGVTYPKAVYSRVVCCHVIVAAGVGVSSMDLTHAVGGDVWLLGMDLWAYHRAAADWVGGFIWPRTGSGKDPSASQMINQWEQIIDLSAVGKQAIYWLGEEHHWSFNFTRLFTGEARRFGVAVQNGFDLTWDLFAAFTISEG